MGTGDVDQQRCRIQVRPSERRRTELVAHFYRFSMWPLLKRDGVGIQYAALTILWNAALGYTPFKRPKTIIQFASLVSDSVVVSTVSECPTLADRLSQPYASPFMPWSSSSDHQLGTRTSSPF